MDSYPDTLEDPNKLDSPSGSVCNRQVDVQLAGGSGEDQELPILCHKTNVDQDKATQTRIMDGIRRFVEEHWNFANLNEYDVGLKEYDTVDDDQTIRAPLLEKEGIQVLSKQDEDTMHRTSTSSSQGNQLLNFSLGFAGLTPPVRESIKKMKMISGGNWNSKEGVSFSRSLLFLFLFLVDTLDLLEMMFWSDTNYYWVRELQTINSKLELALYSIAYQHEPDGVIARAQESVCLYLYLTNSIRMQALRGGSYMTSSTWIRKLHAICFYVLSGYLLIFLKSFLLGLVTISRSVDRYLSKTLGRPVPCNSFIYFLFSLNVMEVLMDFWMFWLKTHPENSSSVFYTLLSWEWSMTWSYLWEVTLIIGLFVAKAERRYSGKRIEDGSDEEENRGCEASHQFPL